jgi:hypothetical protein
VVDANDNVTEAVKYAGVDDNEPRVQRAHTLNVAKKRRRGDDVVEGGHVHSRHLELASKVVRGHRGWTIVPDRDK